MHTHTIIIHVVFKHNSDDSHDFTVYIAHWHIHKSDVLVYMHVYNVPLFYSMIHVYHFRRVSLTFSCPKILFNLQYTQPVTSIFVCAPATCTFSWPLRHIIPYMARAGPLHMHMHMYVACTLYMYVMNIKYTVQCTLHMACTVHIAITTISYHCSIRDEWINCWPVCWSQWVICSVFMQQSDWSDIILYMYMYKYHCLEDNWTSTTHTPTHTCTCKVYNIMWQ